MALEGNLTDFGLSEILQLIAVQQKSGMLSVSADSRSMVIFFRDGKIISTRDRRKKARDPLKDYLLRYGVLSREEILRATHISNQSKLDLTEILVSENLLSEEEMKIHYRNQIQEAVHEVLTWKQCSYKFIPGRDVVAGLKTWGEYSVEGMLMESMRRIDELPRILEEFPDKKMVISRAAGKEPKEELHRGERKLWDMLEKQRTLYDLIAHSAMPAFDTYEALKHLKEKGLITTFLEVKAEKQHGQAEKKGRRKPRRRTPLVFAAALFAAALLVGWNFTARLQSNAVSSNDAAFVRSLERNRLEAKVRWALEAYRATRGVYPQSLGELERASFIDDDTLGDAERLSLRYYLTQRGSAYTLL